MPVSALWLVLGVQPVKPVWPVEGLELPGKS